jgi:enoyl-CoA hydratase/carnithine racemase
VADITVEKDGQIAIVTLNRAAKRNAVTLAMWQELAAIFTGFNADPEVRGVILTGAGGNFSVGADVSEFGRVRSDAAQSKAYEVAVDAASEAIGAAHMPVIAVLAGYCLGGGCHLAMACDFRFADEAAAIGIPAAKLSIVYGVRSTQRLMSLVGLTNAKRVLYSADRYTAAAAAQMGLVDEVSADPMAAALAYTRRIAALAPLSIEGAKRILTGVAMGEGVLDVAAADAFIDHVSDSNDYEEGRRAFAEKRSPDFRGN